MTEDLQLRLTAGKPSQDFEITEKQLDHWIRSSRDLVVADFIEKVTRKGNPIPMDYLIESTGKTIPDAAPLFTITDITSTAPILSVEGDKAIARIDLIKTTGTLWMEIRYISHFDHYVTEGMEFSQADLRTAESDVFSGLTAYRIGNKLYINGMITGEESGLTVNIYYVGEMTGNAAAFSLIGQHVEQVMVIAEKTGRRELGFPELDDNINEGK